VQHQDSGSSESRPRERRELQVAWINALPRLLLFVLLVVTLMIYSREIKIFLSRTSEVAFAGVTIKADLSDLKQQAQSGPTPKELDAVGSRVAVLWARAARNFFQGAEVLWVDDHPENNVAFRHVLTRYHTTVTIATSTAEALDKVRRQDFHAIISDIRRDDPNDSDGLRLLAELRQFGGPLRDIPVIFYVLQKQSDDIPSAFAIETMPDKLLIALTDALMNYRKLD
jgi:CheY-like chemotaxis protein